MFNSNKVIPFKQPEVHVKSQFTQLHASVKLDDIVQLVEIMVEHNNLSIFCLSVNAGQTLRT